MFIETNWGGFISDICWLKVVLFTCCASPSEFKSCMHKHDVV